MQQPSANDTSAGRAQPTFVQFSASRNNKRQAARERIHGRVVHPIDTPRLIPDPLERRDSRASSALSGIRLMIGAVVIHAVIIAAFATMGRLMGEHPTFRPPERLTVKIVETPPPPPEAETPPVAAAPIVPEFAPVNPPTPPPAQPRKPAKTVDAPEPVAVPEAPPAPRRIVGLSLESTVEGNGPGFATGTSRLGQTDTRAADPTLSQRAPTAAPAASTPPPPLASSGAGQRAASHIPTRDTEFEKPKRMRPNRPEFPAALKAQGIEGDVLVKVDIAADGHVTAVGIVRGSGHPEFDAAAKRAAASEQFAPATRDGVAVPFTLTYSYRFRIED